MEFVGISFDPFLLKVKKRENALTLSPTKLDLIMITTCDNNPKHKVCRAQQIASISQGQSETLAQSLFGTL